MSTIFPGVRPSMSLAALPTASTCPVSRLTATMDGSSTTTPLPRTKTNVFAVPRSMARSLEKKLSSDLQLWLCDPPDWKSVHDIVTTPFATCETDFVQGQLAPSTSEWKSSPRYHRGRGELATDKCVTPLRH